MLRHSYSREHCVLIAIASGSELSERELAALLESMEQLDREGLARSHATAMVMIAEGITRPPSAVWRKRIAELRNNVRAPLACVSFVTSSALLRGVGTAIDWLIPSPANLRSVQHATPEEAAAWIERSQGTRAALVLKLVAEARAEHSKP